MGGRVEAGILGVGLLIFLGHAPKKVTIRELEPNKKLLHQK